MRRNPTTLLLFLVTVQAGCGSLGHTPVPSFDDSHYHEKLSAQAHFEGKPSRLAAGISKKEITPPVGTPLSGYARRRGKASQGVHDPLHVRALALKDDTDLLILVSLDLVAVHDSLYRAVLEKAGKKIPLEKSQLFLFATHTHSGTGGMGKRFLERIIGGRYHPEVFERTVNQITEAMEEAVKQMKPARIGWGKTGLEGMIENRMVEGGSVDSELKAVRIDSNGEPMAFLVNMAAHPTILGADNLLFSADFPGCLEKEVESRYPNSICLFANGAAGDQRIAGFTGLERFDRSAAIGRSLAEKLQTALESPAMDKRAEIVTLQAEIKLPPVKIRRGFIRVPSWLGGRLIDREIVLNVAGINDLILVSVPGEMAGEIGLEIKRETEKLGFEPLILGYANGYIGYIIPEKYYDLDAYEADVTFFGPKLDHAIRETVRIQIRFLSERKHEMQARA